MLWSISSIDGKFHHRIRMSQTVDSSLSVLYAYWKNNTPQKVNDYCCKYAKSKNKSILYSENGLKTPDNYWN